jgi:GAF domain-containing protein
VAGWLTTGSAEYLIYLANDLFALIMLAALFYINRRGWVKAAAFGFSLLLIAIITAFFRDAPLDLVLAASFLVTPPCSFLQATFETLYEITRDLAARRDLPDVLDSIARHAQRLLAAASSHIFLYDEARSDLELVVSWAQPTPVGVHLALGEGMAGRVALTRQPLTVEDYRAWPGRSPQLADTANSAVAQVPLLYGGELIGVLGVGELGPTARRFTDEDIRLLTLLAGQAAAAVYNARLFAATSRQAAEMALLNRISLAISAGLELAPTLKALYEQCRQALPVDCFSAALYDPSSGLIRFLFFHDGEADLALPPQDVHARPGLTGAVIKRRQTLCISDVLDPEATRNLQVIHAGGHPARSYVGAPLILRGEIIGVLSMQSYQPNAYTTEHIHLLETIAGQAAVAIENARLYDETRRHAAELEQRVVERTGELSQRRAELQAANTQLRQMDQWRRQFLVNVSHELRTLLTNIIAYLDLLERGNPERRPHYMATLHGQAAALHTLTEDLLMMAQLEPGKVRPEPVPLDVGQLVAALVRDRAGMAAERGVVLRVEVAADLPALMADPRLLRQALINLIADVVEETPRRGTITVRAGSHEHDAGRWIALNVGQAGAGEATFRVCIRGVLEFLQRLCQGDQQGLWSHG